MNRYRGFITVAIRSLSERLRGLKNSEIKDFVPHNNSISRAWLSAGISPYLHVHRNIAGFSTNWPSPEKHL
jgi:hypothetical protein